MIAIRNHKRQNFTVYLFLDDKSRHTFLVMCILALLVRWILDGS